MDRGAWCGGKESDTTEQLSMHAHYMGYVSKFLFVCFFGFLSFFLSFLNQPYFTCLLRV